MDRKAKIIATLGPASNQEPIISKMIQAGMNVARINFSHGTHDEHLRTIKIVRKAAGDLNTPIAILADLSGPKIRVAKVPAEGINLKNGQIAYLKAQDDSSDRNSKSQQPMIEINVKGLSQALKPGNRILLDDGKLEFSVTQIIDNLVEIKVINGGLLLPHKGVNLPGSMLQVKALTSKDCVDLEFAINLGVDAIALSFVRESQDILDVKAIVNKCCADSVHAPMIIAKIERPEAVENLGAILDTADGIMVARGDLGIETSPDQVPIIQKAAILKANKKFKYVITATQMLESMVNNPRPTRAEASDIANAIFDGTDAVMLSGETAMGAFPIESISYMNQIVLTAEKHLMQWGYYDYAQTPNENNNDAIAVCLAARELAFDRDVVSTAVFSLSGKSALLMSKVRPSADILAFTPHKTTFNKMALLWGVQPHVADYANSLEEMILKLDSFLQSFPDYKPGNQVVILCGLPVFINRTPNMALLHTIGEM